MKQVRELLQRVGPYAAAFAVLAILRTTGLAQTIDLVVYDLITNQRPAESGTDTPITLIGIEETDIQRFGWPIDDGLFCEAFDRLNQGGVDVIGFDIYRDKGVGAKQQCLRDRFRDEPTLVSIFNVAGARNPGRAAVLQRPEPGCRWCVATGSRPRHRTGCSHRVIRDAGHGSCNRRPQPSPCHG